MINQRKIAIYIDVIFCVVVLPLIIFISPIQKMYEDARLFTVILIVFIYLTYAAYRKFRIPWLVMQRKYGQVLVFFIIMMGLTGHLAHFPVDDAFMAKFGDSASMIISTRRQRVWLIFLVVSGFSLVIDLIFELFKHVLAMKELETAKNKAELALYKAQIDPHFMFNSLNTIYGMIVSGSDRTEEAFVKFSDILNYTYDSTGQDFVGMDRELDYIGNFMDFQAMRCGGHTKVEWECEVDDDSAQIPPMILITFVENAFKYGASPTKDCIIRIRTKVSEGRLLFETENRVIRKPESVKPGIGIENCRQRLNLLYPDRHVLEVSQENDIYKVRLTIEL
jgi:sensor histidine kinase YesM